jgi:predicted RNA-binding protein
VWTGELAVDDAVSVYVRKDDATNRDVFGSSVSKEINAFLQVAEVL